MEVTQHWRLKKARYALVGTECPHCGHKSFPPRPVCPRCGVEPEAQIAAEHVTRVASEIAV
jgi:uncharacterized OB-fold protein